MEPFDPQAIRELVELISSSNIHSLELERDGSRLKLVKERREPRLVAPQPASVRAAERAEEPARAVTAISEAGDGAAAPALDGLVDFTSPIVGTFYRAPGPALPNFVEVGSRVASGQVLCIVEAMKVMNEIESEIEAEVVEVLATNGQPVEYGEVLFRLRPLQAA